MKPILFNTEMVQAILEGRKTVTRRICKDIGNYDFKWGLDRKPYIGDYRVFEKIEPKQWDWVTLKNQWLYDLQTAVDDYKTYLLKPPYKVGDILYVRETWLVESSYMNSGTFGFDVLYKADNKIIPCIFKDFESFSNFVKFEEKNGWQPSIHMPKKIARIFLKVTDVRVERLQDITSEQAKNEGVDLNSGTPFPMSTARDCNGAKNGLSMYQSKFVILWDSTVKKEDLDKYSWSVNPWVWVIEFERLEEDY